jgi:predicted Zn-dependent protease
MEKILEQKPDDASAMNFIGYTLLIMGKDPEKSEMLIRKASELKPDDGYIMDSLAWTLYKKGLVDEALELLEKASDKVDSDPIIADHLGDALLSKGRKKDAVKAYQRSLKSNPENLVVQEKLRKLEEELGKETE